MKNTFIYGLSIVLILFPLFITAQNIGSDSLKTDSINLPVTTGAGVGKGISKDTSSAVKHRQTIEQTEKHVDVQSAEADQKISSKGAKVKHTVVDTIRVKKHNPKIAAGMSALLPGLGQVYNRKYWKLPIIYVGLGICGYFVYTNTVEYRKYKETYLSKFGIDSNATDYFPDQTLNTVKEYKEYYHKNIEISYIVAGVIYLLNIVDATVDAHLFDFSISDDLTMRIEPTMNGWNTGSGRGTYTGVRLALKF